MKKLVKRVIFSAFAVMLSSSFALSVFAAQVNAGDSFYAFGEQTDKVCEVLGMEESALQDYCKNNSITYFAVDKDNKRQIKLLCYETDFSNSIINISSMTSDNISVLIPEIVGIENAKGDVITKGEQKFIKTVASTADSGGEYILTTYMTVANRKNYFLNFYTLKGEDTNYTDEIFENYAKSEVFSGEKEQSFNLQRILIFVGFVVFTAVFVFVAITVVRDLKKPKEETEE